MCTDGHARSDTHEAPANASLMAGVSRLKFTWLSLYNTNHTTASYHLCEADVNFSPNVEATTAAWTSCLHASKWKSTWASSSVGCAQADMSDIVQSCRPKPHLPQTTKKKHTKSGITDATGLASSLRGSRLHSFSDVLRGQALEGKVSPMPEASAVLSVPLCATCASHH